MDAPLLSVSLSVDYPKKPGILREARFSMEPGEILGLVGQSGSGKSTMSLALLGLLGLRGGTATGSVRFLGRELVGLHEREFRKLRGNRLSLVLQNPTGALNPALKIGVQLDEVWRAHKDGPRDRRRAYILNLMQSVSLPADEKFLDRYPGQLSVGQAQRLLIAMGILHHPDLLIADEATSALDLITQAEVLKLFARLNRGLGMGILYISHDLLSVAGLCHRVAILHEGRIVEWGETAQIFGDPRHEYTRRLVEAIPQRNGEQLLERA